MLVSRDSDERGAAPVVAIILVVAITENQGESPALQGGEDVNEGIELDHADEVDEFTFAVKYEIEDDTGDVQQLIEHYDSDGSTWEWYAETDGAFQDGQYALDYETHHPDNQEIVTEYQYDPGEVRTVVGTYDGEMMHLYVNGEEVDESPFELEDEFDGEPAKMGDLWVGADLDGAEQYLDGKLYDVRLYFVEFDEQEVEVLHDSMTETDEEEE